MAARSIIDVEVNDNTFVKFYADFKRYEAEVDAMGGKWAKAFRIFAPGGGGSKAMGGAAAEAGALEGATGGAAANIGKMAVAAEGLGAAFTAVAAAAVAVGAATIEAAAKISEARRDAVGLGMTIGAHNALNANLAPYTNPANFMGTVSNMQADLGQLGYLAAMGISPEEAGSMDAGQLSVQVLRRMREIYKQHPQPLGQLQYFQAHGLGNFDLATIRNAGNMSDAEFNRLTSDTKGDFAAMNITDKDAAEASQANRDLHRALGRAEVVAAHALKTPIRGLDVASRGAISAQDAWSSGGAAREGWAKAGAAAGAFAEAVGKGTVKAFHSAETAANDAATETFKFAKAGKQVATDLAQALALFEGKRLTSYQDSKGLWTIGIGHHDASVHEGQTETEAQANAQFEQDRASHFKDVLSFAPWAANLDKTRQDALAELDFNMGGTTLRKFKRMLADMQAGNYEAAAEDYLRSKGAKDVKHWRADTVAHWIGTGEETLDVATVEHYTGHHRTRHHAAGRNKVPVVKVVVQSPAGTNPVVAANGAANVN